MNSQYFLLDTNIYRYLSQNLTESELIERALLLANAEKAKGFGALCSVIVAVELICHLLDGDPEQRDCYNALYFLRNHTLHSQGHPKRVVAYPMENVLTIFFRNKNYKHFDSYNDVIKLMDYLTDKYDMGVCKLYATYIKEIKSNQNSFKAGIVNQAETFLNEQGLSWDSFGVKAIRTNSHNKALNKKRIEEYAKGDAFYRLAKLLIDNVYKDSCTLFSNPSRDKLQEYLERFQAPLRLYHYLIKKIGEVEAMKDYDDTRWNTINDMNILFAVCDKQFDNVLLITEDKLVFECMVTTDGWSGKVGKLDQYLDSLDLTGKL